MADVTVITNNCPRDIVDGWELTADERSQFDYLNWDAILRGEDSASFFRYRGEVYDLGDIPAVDRRPDIAPDWQTDWDGTATDSFFSGILVRYCDDMERVIVARYYC